MVVGVRLRRRHRVYRLEVSVYVYHMHSMCVRYVVSIGSACLCQPFCVLCVSTAASCWYGIFMRVYLIHHFMLPADIQNSLYTTLHRPSAPRLLENWPNYLERLSTSPAMNRNYLNATQVCVCCVCSVCTVCVVYVVFVCALLRYGL